MDNETARALLQTIADNAALLFDAQHKLMALEKALEKYEPNLFAAYKKEVEHLRQHPQFVVNPVGYSVLQEKLVQNR